MKKKETNQWINYFESTQFLSFYQSGLTFLVNSLLKLGKVQLIRPVYNGTGDTTVASSGIKKYVINDIGKKGVDDSSRR